MCFESWAEGLYEQRGAKIMTGKPTEITDPNLQELTDSRPTAGDSTWE